MLVLNRRYGETIVIGNDIIVTMLGFRGNSVRIGISAPQQVKVNRLEVHEKVNQAQLRRVNRARTNAA